MENHLLSVLKTHFSLHFFDTKKMIESILH